MNGSRSTWDMWADIEALTSWLNATNNPDDHELTLRIAKIGEEFGEVIAARIGWLGQNPRKGITHSREDVAEELCDVIVTASVALTTLLGDATAARGFLAAKLAKIRARANETSQQADGWRHVTGTAGAA